MGSRLPSAGEVLIIRPAGKKGETLIRLTGSAPFRPGFTCQEVGHSKAGSERSAVQSECSLNDIEHTIPE